MTMLDVQPLVIGGPHVGLVVTTVEPIIHGVVGAQFGDLEFDVGKSVRWTQWFIDDLYIMDTNSGEQRYWVINWTVTFPEAEYGVTGNNFFRGPASWRQEQFRAADAKLRYHDEDWVVFIDSHEGFSFDTRSLPDDYAAQPFKSWVYREVQRAVDANQTVAYLPFFAYMTYSDPQTITYPSHAGPGATSISQSLSVPWYLPAGYLARLIKVSTLRSASFDWSIIDTPTFTTPPGSPKAQVVSYAYAHWNKQDIAPGQTEVPALSAENDLGYQQRNLISLARPLSGVPFGTPWQDPSTDPVSYPGPWAVDMYAATDPDLVATVEERGHTLPAPQTAGVGVPMYDIAMRLNLRDGLWYERGMNGNVPLTWDDVNQVWVPLYDPNTWPQMGVDAEAIPPPGPSSMALRLDGQPGSYVFAADANYFDFADSEAFTLVAVIAPDSWTPSTREVIVSKWDAPGNQCSWYWAIEAGGGLALVISRDGTTPVEVVCTLDDAPGLANLSDNQLMYLAVTVSTDMDMGQDMVDFWVGTDLDHWGSLCAVPTMIDNPGLDTLFASFTGLNVGAINGGQALNYAGYVRHVSIRRGVIDGGVGGDEVGLFRGDIDLDPAYDRYGNLWDNYGNWTFEPLPGTFQITENPVGSGLYEIIPVPVGSGGLFAVPVGAVETPPGSGLWSMP